MVRLFLDLNNVKSLRFSKIYSRFERAGTDYVFEHLEPQLTNFKLFLMRVIETVIKDEKIDKKYLELLDIYIDKE